MVDDEALSAQQDEQASIAEPSAFPRQRHQPFAQARVVCSTRTVANHHPVATDHPARPPFAHLMDAPEVNYGSAAPSAERCQTFFSTFWRPMIPAGQSNCRFR